MALLSAFQLGSAVVCQYVTLQLQPLTFKTTLSDKIALAFPTFVNVHSLSY